MSAWVVVGTPGWITTSCTEIDFQRLFFYHCIENFKLFVTFLGDRCTFAWPYSNAACISAGLANSVVSQSLSLLRDMGNTFEFTRKKYLKDLNRLRNIHVHSCYQ